MNGVSEYAKGFLIQEIFFMEEIRNPPKIFEAISKAMSGIKAIGKEKKNQQQGFMYRGVDDVMNALQPVLIENHIFVVPEVLEQHREERQSRGGGNLTYSILKMKYTFYAEDGSSISAIVIGEGMDSADKSSNKAMSVAFKYACFQILCIPTEEMKDPDADNPDPQPKQYLCCECGKQFRKAKGKNGEEYSAQQVYEIRKQKYGRPICADCAKKTDGKE